MGNAHKGRMRKAVTLNVRNAAITVNAHESRCQYCGWTYLRNLGWVTIKNSASGWSSLRSNYPTVLKFSAWDDKANRLRYSSDSISGTVPEELEQAAEAADCEWHQLQGGEGQ